MNATLQHIERIVRDVLAELDVAPRTAVATAPKTVAIASQVAAPTSDAQSLTLDVRVVTMNDLAGRLDSVRRVSVPRRAIVTPSVRDELIRRGIALEWADPTAPPPAQATRLTMVAMGVDVDMAALAAGLACEGLTVEPRETDCLIAATDQLATELTESDTLAALLTRHTATALCLANRRRGVRAISAVDTAGVASASAQVGANLLVVDPSPCTFFRLKQMIAEFCRLGVRACPKVFRAELG
ncbi:MAG: hypothetical protein LLF97_02320 [Planctomycetaceae bacterium]|nr:hypothetical protein [Planctomycetaceae bacterium]